MRPTVARLVVAAVCLLAGLGGPGRALAAGDLQTGIADDRLLLKNDDSVAAVAGLIASLGVDSVRLHARWIAIAPRPNDKHRPKGFHPADPNDKGYNWAPLDRAVSALRADGVEPILAVTGSGPLWASRNPALDNPRYKPDPHQFGQFAEAVARRYAKQVARYLIWNEPNIPGWLQPQQSCHAGHCVPVSPHLYRELFRSGAAAVRRYDPGAQVMFGTLAPRGRAATSTNATVRPLAFIRAMGCVTKAYKRDRTGPCKTAKPVVADGFAYHPHPVTRSPEQAAPNPDDAAIADLRRLESALDRTTRAGIVKPRTGSRFDIHLTEFGYQTNPPDPNVGVSTTRQARWVQESTYLAWKDPRIKTITQYELQDEPVKTNAAGTDDYASWQSGLLFSNGRSKPLFTAFPNPFWVDVRPGRKLARAWGQVRPGGAHQIELQQRSGSGWTTVREFTTNAFGYWTTELAVGSPAEFRFTWRAPDPDGTGTVERASLSQKVRPGV